MGKFVNFWSGRRDEQARAITIGYCSRARHVTGLPAKLGLCHSVLALSWLSASRWSVAVPSISLGPRRTRRPHRTRRIR
jgi:hypothetical protein